MRSKSYQLKSLNLGKAETVTFGKQTFESAIKKQATLKPVYLSKTGLVGDEQADKKHHGGEGKALCLFSFDHYPYWRDTLNNKVDDVLFGENLTVIGLKEDNAHIGDIFAFGQAIIQVTEPRTPCYKLAAKYHLPDMVDRVIGTGHTGFLLSVLQEGTVSSTDQMVLIEPHPVQASVALVNNVKFNDRFNKTKLEKVLAIEVLPEYLRERLLKQYEAEIEKE